MKSSAFINSHIRALAWFGYFAFATIVTAIAQPIALNERVLVVYNANVPDSIAVADYYLSKRGIPTANKCAISPSDSVAVDWYNFDRTIKTPIKTCLNSIGRDRILYIVFAYQTPFRLLEVPTESGYELRSVDQFIADIWNDQVQDISTIQYHDYYAATQSQGNFYPPFLSLAEYRNQANHQTLYSVWRLDAATPEIARGLVDKAVQTEANRLQGQTCIDRRFGSVNALEDWNYGAGDWDLFRAADFARKAGLTVTEDENEAEFGTAPAPIRCDNAALYAGWYSYNNYNDAFTWTPGAIGFHLDSGSAIDPRSGANWSANALKQGITVTSGAVNEPYLEGLPHADGVFRDLFAGANVGDAFLRNTAFLQWMVINIGDPLYRPFPNGLAPFNAATYKQDALELNPQFVVGGKSSTATVTLAAPAPSGGTEVKLTNNRPEAASLLEKIIIPAGESKATFSIKTQATTYYQAPVISAAFGEKTIRNTLGMGPLLAAIKVSRPIVAGGVSTTGTIQLNDFAPSGGTQISLISDTPSVLQLESVFVPEGKAKITFAFTPQTVAANTTILISASLDGVKETVPITIAPTNRRAVANRKAK